MTEYREQPDIIKFKTPIIHLGKLEQKKVLDDTLIPEEKTSNQNIPSNGCWVKFEDTYGYFKIPYTNYSFLKELIGEKITSYFNLPTVNYHLADATWQMDGKEYYAYGLFSKYARNNDCEYNILNKIDGLKYNIDDLSILKSIDELYPNQPIQSQFRFLIIREFLTQEYDRIPSEILIENNNGKINLGPLTDYEMEWIQYPEKEYRLANYLTFNLEIPEVITQVKQDPYFQESLEKLMVINVSKLLKEVSKEHQIRLIDYDKEYFTKQEKQIKEYVKSKKII